MVLLMCWLAWVINYIDRMVLPPLLPQITVEFHLSLTEAGLLMSGFMFGYGAMQLPSGVVSDRFGRKTMLILGMVGYSTTTVFAALSTSFTQLLVCRILTGLFQGTHLSVANSLLASFFPSDRRGKAIGIHESGPNIGATIAMPFAVIVGSGGGWRQALALVAVPGFIMAVLFLLLVPAPPKSTKDMASFEGKPRNSFARWKPLLPLIIAFSAYAFTNWALYTFIPMYLSRKGIGLVAAGLLFAILPFVGVFSKVLGGTVSDRVGRERIITSALVALVPLMYAITIAGDVATIALVLGMLGLVLFSFSPVIYTKVSELYDSSERGRALGTVSSVGNIVGAVSPAAVGFIADRMGFETSFYTITVVILACAVVSAFAMRLNADSAPQSMLAR